MNLFPIFLKLQGRRCLVVGAGTVGVQKIAGLLEAEAAVVVVEPAPSKELRELAWSKRIVLHKREFLSSDLDATYMVVAATSDLRVNERIYEESQARGIVANVVDVPPLCDF